MEPNRTVIPLSMGCRELKKSWHQVWRLIHLGELDAEKEDGRWLISTSSIAAYRERQSRAPRAA